MLRSCSHSFHKFLAIATIATTLSSLGIPLAQAQGRTAANWSQSEKEAFLDNCQNRATPPGVSTAQLPQYCQCVLNRFVSGQVPVGEITSATRDYPRTPERWSKGVRRAMIGCLPRR